MNGVKFTNLKQIIEFMYHGEVKIAEEELESLLALAENFKVKGLSNVRNKKLAKDNENESNAKKRKLSGDSDVSLRRMLEIIAKNVYFTLFISERRD